MTNLIHFFTPKTNIAIGAASVFLGLAPILVTAGAGVALYAGFARFMKFAVMVVS